MLKEILLYNFQDFSKRLKETDDKAWFSTAGFVSMAIAFNIAIVLYIIFGYWHSDILVPNPGFVLMGIPWAIIFLFIFFNKALKRYVFERRKERIDQKWRLIFWIYYIISLIIFSYAVSFFSSVTTY